MTDGGWVEGRTSWVIVGETVTFDHEWVGATSVSSPSSKVYYNESDVSSTAQPSGSDSVSGVIQTAKPIVPAAIHGNGKYVLEFTATVDGNTEIRKVLLDVIPHGRE